jgi:hypothetical protein
MRLRILELPSEVEGDRVTTPFAIVLDECEEPMRYEQLDRMSGQTGSRGVLVFHQRVDIE